MLELFIRHKASVERISSVEFGFAVYILLWASRIFFVPNASIVDSVGAVEGLFWFGARLLIEYGTTTTAAKMPVRKICFEVFLFDLSKELLGVEDFVIHCEILVG